MSSKNMNILRHLFRPIRFALTFVIMIRYVYQWNGITLMGKEKTINIPLQELVFYTFEWQ